MTIRAYSQMPGRELSVPLLGQRYRAVVLGRADVAGWLTVRLVDGPYVGAVVSVREDG